MDIETHKGSSYGFNRPVTIAQYNNKNVNKSKQRLLFCLGVFQKDLSTNLVPRWHNKSDNMMGLHENERTHKNHIMLI